MSTERCLIWFITAIDPTDKRIPLTDYFHQVGKSPAVTRQQAIKTAMRTFEKHGGEPESYCWRAVPYFGSDTCETMMKRTRSTLRRIGLPEKMRRQMTRAFCRDIRMIIGNRNAFQALSNSHSGTSWVH